MTAPWVQHYRSGRAVPEGRGDGTDGFRWVNVEHPTSEQRAELCQELRLPGLIERYLEPNHKRASLEPVGTVLYAVLRTVHYDEAAQRVDLGEVQLVLGEDFVLTLDYDHDTLARVRAAAHAAPDLVTLGPAAVLLLALDRLLEDCRPALDALADDVDDLEERVFSADRDRPTEQIHWLSRQALAMHRALDPLAELVQRLVDDPPAGVPGELRAPLRRERGRVLATLERADSLLSRLAGALDANLAQIGVQQNEDARRISAWAAIAAVPTVLAGIYGMNFQHMPELDWTWGYPTVLALMAVLCTLLYSTFRRNGWL